MDLFGNFGDSLFALLDWQTILAMVAASSWGSWVVPCPEYLLNCRGPAVPFSYNLDARLALILLVSITSSNYGGPYCRAGSIHRGPLQQLRRALMDTSDPAREGSQALGLSLVGSCIGGVCRHRPHSVCVPLARVCPEVSPAATSVSAIFGLSTVASLAAGM